MAIRYWLVVQPLDRARELIAAGVVQGAWGRREIVAPMGLSDGVVLYSPRESNPDGDPLRSVVAAGRVTDEEAYREGGRGSVLWRRDVEWLPDATVAPIRPLRDLLEFTRDDIHWGERLRPGVLELSHRDFAILEDAVRRPSPEPSAFVLRSLRAEGYPDAPRPGPRNDGPQLIR